MIMRILCAAGDGWGAILIEMAGACWVMPEFYGTLKGVDLISTLMQPLLALLNKARGHAHGEAEAPPSATKITAAIRGLWGAGGPLCTLARSVVSSAEPLKEEYDCLET